MEFITHRSLSRLSLNGKFVLVVILSVMTAIAFLVGLIICRETTLLLDDSKKNAEVLALSLGTSIKESMLSGRPEEAKRFIRGLSKLPGVHRLGVLKEDGSPAFVFTAPLSHWKPSPRGGSRTAKVMHVGRNFIEFLKPIMYEQRCRPSTRAVNPCSASSQSVFPLRRLQSPLIASSAGSFFSGLSRPAYWQLY